MKLALWLAALAAAPVSAQTRAVAPVGARVAPVAAVAGAVPALPPLGAPALSAPSLSFSVPSPSVLSVRLAAALDAPASLPAAAAAPAELAHAAEAAVVLSQRAEDLGAARGLKGRSMTGADFIAMVDDAGRALDAEAASAPSPDAAAAARRVRAAMARVVRALVPEDAPFLESAPRAISVWQVFNQEMANAAQRGTLAAVAEDAELFASQVEDSVAPKPVPAPEPREVHPEDPEGYSQISEPGSIFGWRPIEKSPGHGFAPLDALIRGALSDKTSPARAAGFELRGAAARADARIFFYGERHTDGGLITENMRRLVDDARPGKPMIVLVEGYTGWPMRGWQAVKYLADRGLDSDALSDKGAFLEVRGWDTIDGYEASKHPLLQHHMDLLALNHLAWSEARGWRYYRDFARAAWTAWKGRRELWKIAVDARNQDLNRAVARAAAEADANGGTVHVVAGSDHLLERPRLNAALPRLFPPSFRKSLAAAVGGRPFWASKPAETR